jgi:hypothetical protein
MRPAPVAAWRVWRGPPRFVAPLEKRLGRKLAPQKPGPKPEAKSGARDGEK